MGAQAPLRNDAPAWYYITISEPHTCEVNEPPVCIYNIIIGARSIVFFVRCYSL